MRRMHSADLSLLYMIDFMVSKELRLKFQEILNDESLEEHEKVKKIYTNRSFAT